MGGGVVDERNEDDTLGCLRAPLGNGLLVGGEDVDICDVILGYIVDVLHDLAIYNI